MLSIPRCLIVSLQGLISFVFAVSGAFFNITSKRLFEQLLKLNILSILPLWPHNRIRKFQALPVLGATIRLMVAGQTSTAIGRLLFLDMTELQVQVAAQR